VKIGEAMSNVKVQSSNEAQNPNIQRDFWGLGHLSLI
jgi:hypothetical protein